MIKAKEGIVNQREYVTMNRFVYPALKSLQVLLLFYEVMAVRF